jgi:TolB-like protein/predicted negative regulator of RcsB-dependent stress response
MVGQTLTHYHIREQIGAGGMGVVFLAHDEQLERDVAIKVLPAGTLDDEASRKRFRKEAVSLARLNHPNIATIHEFGTEDGTDFLVTEYVAGQTLSDRLAGGPLPSGEVVRLGMQLAEGLGAAHRQDIVHRDLKPANLRLTTDGRLKILDFGLAQFVRPEANMARTMSLSSLTTSQQITGTLPYMAPEQLRGEPADLRTDIWAVGAVLYEMSTARRPFPETNGPMLIDAILNRSPEPPSKVHAGMSLGLETVILKALEKDPARRYQTALELHADLERLTAGVRPIAARRPWTSRTLLMGLALVMIMVAALVTHSVLVKRRASPSAASAISRRSVAVLGFKNLSGRPDTAWLSTALSEMLSTEIAAGEKLITISGENVSRVKTDLSLPETDSLAPDTLTRLRKNLGADFVVLGSYLDLSEESGVRLDLRVQDAQSGNTVASLTVRGKEGQLDQLVTDAGAQVRQKLGITGVPETEEVAAKAALPANLEASRYYAQGLEKLRSFDPLAARDLFQKAIAADPQHALSYARLAAAWSALGYDVKAAEAARKSFELSTHLPREERSLVEGQYYETSHQWDKAVESYKSIYSSSPDNLDYGIKLASAQINAGKSEDALGTIASLRKLPKPKGDDLRLDLQEISAARTLSDFKRQIDLAAKLADKAQAQGARLLVARARQAQCGATRNLGDAKAAIPFCEQARQISAAAGDHAGEASAINSAANAFYDQGDLPGARKMYAEAANIYRAMGNQGGLAGSIDNLASVIGDQGNIVEARKISEEALAIYRETGDKTGVAETLNNIASEMIVLGDLSGAQRVFGESLEIWREIKAASGTATALNNIGDMRTALGDLAGARGAYEESFTRFRDNGEKSKSAYPLVGLANVLTASGEFAAAQKKFDEAIALCKESGEKHELAMAFAGLGDLRLQQADLTGARQNYEAAYKTRKELGEKEAVGESQLQLAALAIEEGRPGKAKGPAHAALEEFRAEKMVSQQVWAYAVLSRVYLAQGKLAEAQKSIALGSAIAQRSQQRDVNLEFQIMGARIKGASGNAADLDSALRALESTIADAQKVGLLRLVYESTLAWGEVQIKSGNAAEGRARLASLQREALAKGYLLAARKAAKAQ